MRLILLMLSLYAVALGAAPRVVTSIAPLNELTAAIGAGVITPMPIIDGHASPHHFAFRPSHMRSLQQADLVIWIDRHFEGGFNRLPEILPDSVRLLELMPRLGARSGDGHIWYSPRLLQRSADLIGEDLAGIDAGNRQRYLDNTAALKQTLADWSAALAARLAAQPPRVLTDHAFLEPLAQEFGLEHVVAVHDHHDAGGSLHDLGVLEQRLRQQRFRCLLTLGAGASPLGRRLAEKYQLRVIDVTAGITAGTDPGALLRRLERLAQALEQCG